MLASTTRLALSLALIGGATSASAQTAAAPVTREVRVQPVTVSATRTERDPDSVPATVTVHDADAIERSGARDLKDLFAGEIDVELRAQARRFTAASSGVGRGGNEAINIRGLEGNQVLMLVDGIRVPSAFSFGPFVTGRGDYFDIDSLARVEVLRGPASTQYGSDGLAGAVSLVTLGPDDVLKPGRAVASFVRSGYASVDRSWNSSAAVAGQSDGVKALLLYTRRDGHELRNQGDNHAADATRTAPNPLDSGSDNLLGKLVWQASAEHELGLTAEWLDRRVTSEVLSGRAATVTASTSVIDLDADDRLRRRRVSLQHRYTPVSAGLFSGWTTQLYAQDAELRQYTAEDRASAADRTRDNLYKEKIVGLGTQAGQRFAPWEQRLSWGLDLSRATITGLRGGTVAPAGESFPSKPFPDTDTTLAGAFVQDELQLGPVGVFTGLRFDHYKLAPSASGYTGRASTLSDRALTPRLGAVWNLDERLAPYAQWALGFKAPQADQVNNGFANPAQGYRSIANPDLKPEHANSIELGLRGRLDTLRWQLAGFDNRYRDFISQQRVSGAGTVADPTVFQYINLAKVRIRGAEARAEWRPLRQLTVDGGIAGAHGDSEIGAATTPLDSVAPLRAVLGASWDAGAWSARLRWRHANAKHADRVADATQYLSRASDVLDLGASWRITPALRLLANIDNVADARYWRWNDVRGQLATSSVIDAYTAPGRSFQLALRADF
ncbi:TonB-dependent hemoglobin/transferrin/lactoferrin family receptor [Derxia lacustris]|uniref:TonB-dependent hemoglobin/transferrin/lactoferrin family receptor n=1 Tax=Derxia lacustris TaxID=764842 RepID=UPI000A177EE4|nr:TonB-dependent hemoglobin/transferrin/lactoferrin family receptor [Derxia lacustris]